MNIEPENQTRKHLFEIRFINVNVTKQNATTYSISRGGRVPLENMLEGLITQEPQTVDAFFTTEITDHLFQKNK
jgi:hypothetical protein